MSAVISHSRPTLDSSDYESVAGVLRSGMIAEGELCAEFERRFAEYLGVPGAIAVSSGTLALELALRGLQIGPDDKVLMPTYMCRAGLDACRAVGAEPVLVDSGEDFNIDTEQLLKASGNCQAAIIPHMFGSICSVEKRRAISIPIIEDCTHAIGGSDPKGRKVGTFGDISVTSLHATKMMTAGEGGIIASTHSALIKHIRRIKTNDDSVFQGRHLYPLSDLQAALGISQLERLDGFVQRRHEIAAQYRESLVDCDIKLPPYNPKCDVPFRFPLRIRGSVDTHMAAFAALGVMVRKPVAIMLHKHLGMDAAEFPIAEKLYRETISLPIYPSLIDAEIIRVIDATHQVLTHAEIMTEARE